MGKNSAIYCCCICKSEIKLYVVNDKGETKNSGQIFPYLKYYDLRYMYVNYEKIMYISFCWINDSKHNETNMDKITDISSELSLNM